MKKLSVILIILIFVFTALSATAESPTPALTRVPTSAPTATPEELADMVTQEETRVLIKPLETPDRLAGQMDMQPGSSTWRSNGVWPHSAATRPGRMQPAGQS